MPTIRDGRGVLTVHDMGTPPPARPPGEIERRQGSPAPPEEEAPYRGRTASQLAESRARGNEVSASRARGAAAAGFVKGHTGPRGTPAVDPAGKTAAEVRRETAALAESKKPARPWALGKKRSPETKARMAAAMTASYERRRAAKPAQIVSSDRPIEGREASVPATDADERGPTGARKPATPAATPLGSSDPPPVVGGAVGGPAAMDRALGYRLDVLLPCEGCVHAVVCAIKPVLVAWAETLEVPVSPHEAIGVGAISISCAHELQAAS